jgi:glutamate synthase domain-containing protein 2
MLVLTPAGKARYAAAMLKLRLGRYTVFLLCAAGLIAGLALRWYWLAGVAGPLFLIGIWNLAQTRHAILRNYPVIGHVRWLAELIRPEIRQYLLEDEDDAVPFSRAQRSLIYQRAKQQTADHPFGTLVNVYAEGYEYVTHSMRPAEPADPKSFRVTIGGDQCSQPYSASLFNVSAMSFGALSANAIRALNKGAALGGFYHDTGEGSISPYHREMGGDLVWELGSGYFGCRSADGHFDPKRFAEQASSPQVKMIEIKLSQGAKPGHGGILPAKKVTREIAETRGVPMGQDCVSPSHHTAFSTPLEMMAFITQLRTLSGGKPVGFKLCIGHGHEFMALVKAMLESGVRPDFIVVDGGEGGTGAAPLEFSDRIGTPMREGLLFVHNVLTGAGLRDQIKLGVAGKIVSAFDLASVLAIGADWANAARGFMFALGCVQSMSCHTNRCPTGVATQDPGRQRALVVPDKAERVAAFQANTLKALADMLAACGLSTPEDLEPHHLSHRGPNGIEPFPDFHRMLEPGSLLGNACPSPFYREEWARAQAGTFAPKG